MVRQLQDNMKRNNICIIEIPEGEEDQGIENLFEKVMIENFPNLMTEKVTQIQEAQKQKASPKMGRQKNNIQSKDMEDSPLK